ncbi:hypothetical protein ACFL96_13875, partial [Thermoproteota archaeon]
MKRVIMLMLAVLMLAAVGVAAEDTTVFFFHGLGCPHCADMSIFLADMEAEYPGFEVKAFEVYYNKDNQFLLDDLNLKYNNTMPGVPVFFIDETVILGF